MDVGKQGGREEGREGGREGGKEGGRRRALSRYAGVESVSIQPWDFFA